MAALNNWPIINGPLLMLSALPWNVYINTQVSLLVRIDVLFVGIDAVGVLNVTSHHRHNRHVGHVDGAKAPMKKFERRRDQND